MAYISAGTLCSEIAAGGDIILRRSLGDMAPGVFSGSASRHVEVLVQVRSTLGSDFVVSGGVVGRSWAYGNLQGQDGLLCEADEMSSPCTTSSSSIRGHSY